MKSLVMVSRKHRLPLLLRGKEGETTLGCPGGGRLMYNRDPKQLRDKSLKSRGKKKAEPARLVSR